MNRILLVIYILIVSAASYLIFVLTKDLNLALMVGVDLFVGVTVLSFTFVQIGLNRKLIELQDYVAVSVVPDPSSEKSLRFYNTGKLNMYIHRIEVRDGKTDSLIGATDIFSNPRLLPAGTLESSYYWYPMPKDIKNEEEFKLILLATDELNRKWLSNHGGILLAKNELRVWSHKTHKKHWKIYKKDEIVPK